MTWSAHQYQTEAAGMPKTTAGQGKSGLSAGSQTWKKVSGTLALTADHPPARFIVFTTSISAPTCVIPLIERGFVYGNRKNKNKNRENGGRK